MAATDFTPETRQCSKCQIEKPLEAFAMRNVNGRIYPRRQCRACEHARDGVRMAVRSKQWAKDHPERVAQKRTRHLAKRKALGLPLHPWAKANPERVRGYSRAYYAKNREESRAKSREYRATHLEELREKDRQSAARRRLEDPEAYKRWLAQHPEKRREYNARARAQRKQAVVIDLSEAQWEEIKAAKGYRCDYCGKKLKKLTKDHVTPLIKRGDHTLWNIVVACQPCNSRKGSRAPLKPVQPLLLTIAPKNPNKD